MSLYMETTDIKPERTALEIQAVLQRAGAGQIASQYENLKIKGLTWTMKINGCDVLFEMPVRVDPIFQIFKKRRGYVFTSPQQTASMLAKAERVAWRQLLRWVEAQCAMLETNMVQPGEVFLAYALDRITGRTMYQHLIETQFKALPPAS